MILLMVPAGAGIEKVPAGIRMETEGVIVQKSDSMLRIRRHTGSEFVVVLTPNTEIVEKKVNPFRGASNFSPDALVLGLNVRVEGFGDTQGSLLAEKVRFTKDELKVARTISSRVVPVEERLSATEQELNRTQAEMRETKDDLSSRADSLQGRVEELDDAFQLARSEARDAQSTANQAMEKSAANEARFGSLDQYREQEMLTIRFPFNSAELTQESKQRLDELAERLANEEGFVLEVVGYTSSDGNLDYNRKLSEMRSETVISYLAEVHTVPLRRIIRPYGFGEGKPVADNSTRDGRQQNRRVEVRVLQNVGINADSESMKSKSELAASLN
jgi:outer membrane protein OmpA-like peptidoglycan-associated protein